MVGGNSPPTVEQGSRNYAASNRPLANSILAALSLLRRWQRCRADEALENIDLHSVPPYFASQKKNYTMCDADACIAVPGQWPHR